MLRVTRGEIKILNLGKARVKNITQSSMKVRFTIMKDTQNENYLGDIIGNKITEKERFD